MKPKLFLRVIGGIFSLITFLHILRIGYGWKAVIGGLEIELWASWLFVVVGLFFAYQAFRLSRQMPE